MSSNEGALSKSDYLKRYLEPKKGKKRRRDDGSVKYIAGDLPETLDGLHRSVGEGDFEFPPDVEDVPTVVRPATLAKGSKKVEPDTKKKEDELKARYELWNMGVKTVQETYEKLRQQEYESSKPLARYADDKDLTEHLKSQIHSDDPMAAYFAKKEQKKLGKVKKKKKNERGDSDEDNSRPKYQGVEPPPNRFGIMPGYRWDGVDRSNGFEKKIVEEATRKRLDRQIAQKWSVEDM